MAGPKLSEQEIRRRLEALAEHGNRHAAARALGLQWKDIELATTRARELGIDASIQSPKQKPASSTEYEVDRLLARCRRLENELKTLRRDAADGYTITKTVLGLSEQNLAPPMFAENVFPSASAKHPMMPIVATGDWHIGEIVRPSEINGWNSYSTDIAEERLERMLSLVIRFVRSTMKEDEREIPGIKVLVTGDLLSGVIHEELAETNELTSNESIIWCVQRLCWLLTRLADEFGYVECDAVPGNHGRQTKKPRAKRYASLNSDHLIYLLARLQLANDPRIRLNAPNSGDALVNVYGYEYLLTHGDRLGVKGGDGFIGVIGPIMRGGLKVVLQYHGAGRPIRSLVIGHYHRDLWMPPSVIGVNTLKGSDEFSVNVLRAPPSPATQLLWFHHAERGPVRPITLDVTR